VKGQTNGPISQDKSDRTPPHGPYTIRLGQSGSTEGDDASAMNKDFPACRKLRHLLADA
jgi:hypothetical protein